MTLAERIMRMGVPEEPPYRIARPDIEESVPGVRLWLLRHEGGGWLQCDDEDRMGAARRFLFIAWLRARGELNDGH